MKAVDVWSALGVILVSVGLGFLLTILYSLSGGCGHGSLYEREWAKVPDGGVEWCDAQADEAAIEYLGPQLVRGVGFMDCDGKGHCTCRVHFEPLWPSRSY